MSDLEIGSFYWVLPVLDADAPDDWENYEQPARYVGNEMWNYLGIEGNSMWPVRWVGEEIIQIK